MISLSIYAQRQFWNGQPGFKGQSRDWTYTQINFTFFILVKTSDTLIISFDYESDPLSAPHEGWLIDDIRTGNEYRVGGVVDGISPLNLKVFPNPATEFLHIILPALHPSEQASISILNQLGQEVFSSGLNQNNTEISIVQLASGLYNYVIKNQDGIVKSGRLLVE